MKVWKRCLAALLAFTIAYTSSATVQAAGTFDKDTSLWKASTAEIIAEAYGIEGKAAKAIFNGAVDQGEEYECSYPYENTQNPVSDLVAVDFVNRTVYAKVYNAEGYLWLPTKAVLRVGEDIIEEITLDQSICNYNDSEYGASAAFAYDGNSYTVEVTYTLDLEISEEEQLRIAGIPYIMAKTAYTMIYGLKALNDETKNLAKLTDYLPTLLAYTFETEEIQTTTKELEDGTILEEETTVTVQTPAFDPEADEAIIAAIQALYDECTANEGMLLYHMSEEYKSIYASPVSYTMEKGEAVHEQAKTTHSYMKVIAEDKQLRTVLSKIEKVDPTFYSQIRNLRTLARNLVSSTRNPKPLDILNDVSNWPLLDESVRNGIFREGYEAEDLAALESACYALRNEELTYPAADGTVITAAAKTVSCDITFYNIHVTIDGSTASQQIGDSTLTAMEPYTADLTLLEGTTEEEVRQAILETGIEKTALDAWNAKNSAYQISPVHYDRTETSVSGGLHDHIEDYRISYTPNYYNVKTNFNGSNSYPYGYLYELPVSNSEEVTYEYAVALDSGSQRTYFEGAALKITSPMTITRIEDTQKTEYRLYDLLITDVQYDMNDAAKKIFSSSAVKSPTLEIKVPDGKVVGDVYLKDGVYYVEASSYPSGIQGMTWEPAVAYIMKEEATVQEAEFKDGTATWTTDDFTHINIIYRLQIEKVKGDFFNRDLDEAEDVLYALNLPHELVTDVAKQNQLLCGTEGVTAKSLYTRLSSLTGSLSLALKLLAPNMESTEGYNAILQLQGSEQEIIKGANGETLGYGGWDTTNDTLALYTYLDACAKADWSLAVYYQKEYYEDIGRQADIVASCLDAITKDPGFDPFMESMKQSSTGTQLKALVPELRALADNVEGPHEALNVNDPGFGALIELLISLEGETAPVEASNGVYAYTSVQRNHTNNGSITVSVRIDTAPAKTKEIFFEFAESEVTDQLHTLTEAEAKAIEDAREELEAALGLTEEEKLYYEDPPIAPAKIPAAKDVVGSSTILSWTYEPKTYTVTIQGVSVEEYQESFRYGSKYVIELPAYSEDPEAEYYYIYQINGEAVKVKNGDTGYYTFAKEDLLTLFASGSTQIQREKIPQLSGAAVIPKVTLQEGVILGYRVDTDNGYLFLDADPKGLKKSQFESLVKFCYEDGQAETTITNTNREKDNFEYLANGTKVECRSFDEEGKEHLTAYTVVIMGDVNRSGKVDTNDVQCVIKNYLGTASDSEAILSIDAQYAANMNDSSCCCDSNDAYLIFQKILHWDSEEYKSVLMR